MSEKKLTFIEHLGDLRRALVISGIAIIVCFGVAVGFWKYLHEIMMLPIRDLLPPDSEPMYSGVFGPIFYMLKLGLIGGLIAAAPVVFWQLWWFISPGLYPKEKRLAIPFVLAATVFFAGGVAFCYFLVLPFMAAYSIGQMTEDARMLLELSHYLSNASMFILAFGLIFEMPVLVFLLAAIGLVTPRTLGRYRKYVLLGSFIIAAIITPSADPINQTIVGAPLYVMYEMGILASRLFLWRKSKRSPEEDDASA
jgi:sec-independent protein translocase protein TatC